MFKDLQANIEILIAQFDRIDAERKSVLANLGDFVRERMGGEQPVDLIFICTHNSRRSHLSRIWAQTAAAWYGVANVQTWSGGTEATAFNPRAVAALQRTGFHIQQTTRGDNPVYHVSYAQDTTVLTAFSKVYTDAPNPGRGFAAIMTCGQADEACPAVFGCAARLAVAYDDPKVADDTPAETQRYDERCLQIGREMLYAFSLVNQA